MRVWVKLGYEIVEKIFKFYIRKSQWKIDFLTIFLLFSRVPGAVGAFFAFCSWGEGGIFPAGVEFRRVGGEAFPP